VPPLDYARVYRLKQRLPGLEVVLNGGVVTVEQTLVHLTKLDGVMMGRAAYQEPWRLLDVDPVLFGTPAPVTSVRMAAEAMIAYLERETAAGIRASCILRHVVGLFHRVPGARAFRRHLSIASVKPGAGAEVLRDALSLIASGAAAAETAAA
jgi:tRNA-dihydrouridine synthase A